MDKQSINTIVVGGLNTDIVALGADKIISAGELTYANTLRIGPGGKSRNIAQMIAELLGSHKVAMIGKTSQDPYGLWKLPVDSLKNAGVNIDNIKIEQYETTKQYPGIALIPVDKNGNNQIYVLPGITNYFSPSDIDDANDVFNTIQQNNGVLVLSLELPIKTAMHAVSKAIKMGIRVLLDPGGITENGDYSALLRQKLFLIKPNGHEAKLLTDTPVNDFESAKKAAEKLLGYGIENVLITLGKDGGYLFNRNTELHIPIPEVKIGVEKDETGCGDQTIAAISAALTDGKDIVEAAKIGILAGTLQFGKSGIVPITKEEIKKYL